MSETDLVLLYTRRLEEFYCPPEEIIVQEVLRAQRGHFNLAKTSKEHEQNALPDILMTMAQIPVADVALELAEVSALHALFRAVARDTEGS